MVKSARASAGSAGVIPGVRTKIPHAPGQLSPRATTTEPAQPRACAPSQEKPPGEESV